MYGTVRMCKVTTMCGSNPTHHPGMHSHNVWFGQMCTVSIMRNLCKKLYYITVNLIYRSQTMYVRTHVSKNYEYMRNWLQYNQLQSIGAENVPRQKNPAKKILEKYWSLSRMICSSVWLKTAKEKVNWHVYKRVRTYVCMDVSVFYGN